MILSVALSKAAHSALMREQRSVGALRVVLNETDLAACLDMIYLFAIALDTMFCCDVCTIAHADVRRKNFRLSAFTLDRTRCLTTVLAQLGAIAKLILIQQSYCKQKLSAQYDTLDVENNRWVVYII